MRANEANTMRRKHAKVILLAWFTRLGTSGLDMHSTHAEVIRFSGGAAIGVQSFSVSGLDTTVSASYAPSYIWAEGSLGDAPTEKSLLTLGGFHFTMDASTPTSVINRQFFHVPGTINDFLPITLRIEGIAFSGEPFGDVDSALVECMPVDHPRIIHCPILPGESLQASMELSDSPRVFWTLSSPNMSVSGENSIEFPENVITEDVQIGLWQGFPSGTVSAGGFPIQRNIVVWDSTQQGAFDGIELNVSFNWALSPFATLLQSEFMPPGDVNSSGTIDLDDLNLVHNYFGTVNPFPGQGETNGDGIVDLSDLNNVRNNFGYDAVFNPAPPAGVPEPGA